MASAERAGNNLKGVKDLCLKMDQEKARIWPWLSYRCHIGSAVDCIYVAGGRNQALNRERYTIRLHGCVWGPWLRAWGSGLRVWGLGCGVQGSGSTVWGLGCWVQGPGSTVWGLGCRVQGSGSRVQGVGYRVLGEGYRV